LRLSTPGAAQTTSQEWSRSRCAGLPGLITRSRTAIS
jgi:hypothetical protein